MLQPKLNPPNDVIALVRRCAGGESAAWDEFVHRYHRKIVLYAVRASRIVAEPNAKSADVRNDLIQDVYLRLLANDYRALDVWRGDTEQSFLNYLATIVHAVACDTLKRRRSLKRAARVVSLDAPASCEGTPLGDTIPAPDRDSPERVLFEHLAPERLRAILERAERGPQGRRNQVIFMLHAIEGLTAAEIANLPGLEISVANVESAIRRTRERLRFTLKDTRQF